MDSYFATVEQQANPYLRGKPVGVIKAEGRGCIIASSCEAKRLGIKTGITVWDAKKIYPKIILVPADFWKYFSITEQFLEILKQYSPSVEVFSLDEAFLDLTGVVSSNAEALCVAIDIKERIREEIGEWVTVSIGVSFNRLLAKLAGELSKPDGLMEINKENKDDVLNRTKLTDLCGIGDRLMTRLRTMGVNNISELRKISLDNLIIIFGEFLGNKLYNMARGIDLSPVVPYQKIPLPKSVSRTFTLFKDTKNPHVIKQSIYNLCLEAAEKLRNVDMAGRLVAFFIRGEEQSYAGHLTRRVFTNDGSEIFKIAYSIFKESGFQYYVRFLGVYVGLLEKCSNIPISIFEEERKREVFLKALDSVNKRWGDFTIYPATILGGELIRPEVTGFFGDKKIRLKVGEPSQKVFGII